MPSESGAAEITRRGIVKRLAGRQPERLWNLPAECTEVGLGHPGLGDLEGSGWAFFPGLWAGLGIGVAR